MASIPPAGFSPAAAFTIVRHAEALAPVPILADSIDPKTGDYLSLEDSASIADGLVVTLLRTERDSGAAVLGLGQRFRTIRNVTSQAPELAESMAREALAPASDAGVVQLSAVGALVNAEDGTQLDASIDYLDLLAPPDDRAQSQTFTL